MGKEVVGSCICSQAHTSPFLLHLHVHPPWPPCSERPYSSTVSSGVLALGSRCPWCQQTVYPIVFLGSIDEEWAGKERYTGQARTERTLPWSSRHWVQISAVVTKSCHLVLIPHPPSCRSQTFLGCEGAPSRATEHKGPMRTQWETSRPSNTWAWALGGFLLTAAHLLQPQGGI